MVELKFAMKMVKVPKIVHYLSFDSPRVSLKFEISFTKNIKNYI